MKRAERKQGMNVQAIWYERMQHEGRVDEAETLIAKHIDIERTKSGKAQFGARGRAMWPAMKELDYTGADREWELYNERHAGDTFEEKKAAASRMSSEIEEAMRQLPGLPSVAQPALEFEWVSGHPAMMRKDLLGLPDDAAVPATGDDVLRAPNGLPPSRRAVNMLINWMRRPDQFHQSMIAIHKKAEYVGEETVESKEEAADVSLHELRQLLAKHNEERV